MPLYEYICNTPECETEYFEVVTSYDETIERCPSCKEGTRDRKTFYQFDFNFNQGLVKVQRKKNIYLL